MMNLFFIEDDLNPLKLYPFTLTRNIQDIRVGILTLNEKWEKLLQKNNLQPSKEIKVPANLIPSAEYFNQPSEYKLLNYSWEIFKHNDWAIREDFKLLTAEKTSQKISGTNKTITEENIFIEEGAVVEHSILNASAGPIYIGKNAEVMEGSFIRGPVAICKGAVVKMGTKLYGATTIGPYCTVGGEIKNSVLFGYSNKAHDGYLGDSVIGEWCNLGAGTSNSNIKNTAGDIKVWNGKEFLSAGTKCGLLMGDYSRAAINTSFNTGTVAGVACNIFCREFPPKHINSFTWGDKRYDLKKALEHISNWKKLKGKELSEKEIESLTRVYHSIQNNA